MEAPSQTPGHSQTVAQAAANATAPDPLTAAILAKHARGEPLTPQESGKLGAWRALLARAQRAIGWKPGASVPAAGPAAGPSGNAPGMATVAPGDAPGDRMAPVPVNPRLAAVATNVVLTKTNALAVNWMHSEAIAAGATGRELSDLVNSASLSKDDRALLTELAPEILAECKVAPLWFAVAVVGGVVGLHATNMWAAVRRLQEMRQGASPKTVSAATEQSAPPPPVTQSVVKKPIDISIPKGPLAFPPEQ